MLVLVNLRSKQRRGTIAKQPHDSIVFEDVILPVKHGPCPREITSDSDVTAKLDDALCLERGRLVRLAPFILILIKGMTARVTLRCSMNWD